MDIRLGQGQFLEMLETVIDAVPSRPTIPVLSTVLLRVEGRRCTLSATDLELSITTSTPCEPIEEGRATFPARKLYEVVRELAPGELALDERGGRFTLKSANGEYSVLSVPADEFPSVITAIEGQTLALDGGLLKRMIAKVAFAAYTDQTRPTLCGVSWRVGPSRMTMIATDTHRLAKITREVAAPNAEELHVIVPPRVVQSAVKLLREDNPLERVTVGERQIHFAFARADLVGRLIEGAYADVDAVIPKDSGRHLVAELQVLLPAVRRVLVLASEQSHQIRLALAPDRVELTTLNRDSGSEAREQIEAEYDGGPMEVGYNANYLHEALTKIDSERVRVAFGETSSAAIIEPAEQLAGEQYFCLVMPLRLVE